jgi:hypothetical protein
MYSGPLTNWTFADLLSVEHEWGVMHKRAWQLTDGHNSAPFILPQEEGGFQTHTPSRLLAKTGVGLIEKLARDLDGETLQLMQEEWILLTDRWGTERVKRYN